MYIQVAEVNADKPNIKACDCLISREEECGMVRMFPES